MTPFVTSNNDKINGSQLTLTAETDNTTGNPVDQAQLSKSILVNSEDTNFVSADSDKGTFTNTFDLTGKLHIPSADNKAIHAGTYQSTMTWTLSTTPKAAPAN